MIKQYNAATKPSAHTYFGIILNSVRAHTNIYLRNVFCRYSTCKMCSSTKLCVQLSMRNELLDGTDNNETTWYPASILLTNFEKLWQVFVIISIYLLFFKATKTSIKETIGTKEWSKVSLREIKEKGIRHNYKIHSIDIHYHMWKSGSLIYFHLILSLAN